MKRILSVLLFLCFTVPLTACSYAPDNKGNSTNETYIMYEALDAAAYSSYISKEINACTNQLSTMMLLAESVVNDGYSSDDALESAKYALGIIDECYEQVDIMTPPFQYEDTRTNVLRMMENAETDISTLISILSTKPLDTEALNNLISYMQNDFIALTAEFNIFYE
ncbi:MAG: hypothetical protein IJ341_01865 [Bacteroidales bacterium]|nr:hypothetical protein [Bacteroidales bacterium]